MIEQAALAEVRASLQAAKRYLLDHGWTRGTCTLPGGPRCAVQAIVATTMPGLVQDRAIAALTSTFEKSSTGCSTIIYWNDVQASAEQVLGLYDRAIAAVNPVDNQLANQPG